GDGFERTGADRHARPQWSRHPRAGLARKLQRERRRRAGEHDRNPACVRDELESHLDDRSDAPVRDEQHLRHRMTLLRPFALATGALLLGACATYQPIEEPLAITDVPPPPPQNGAIYQTGYDVALFENATARRVGDIVTIHLVEATNASKSS